MNRGKHFQRGGDSKRTSQQSSPSGDRMMDPKEYREVLKNLGMSQADAAKFLGVNARTSRRYALGESPIPVTVEKLLFLLLREQNVIHRPNEQQQNEAYRRATSGPFAVLKSRPPGSKKT